MFVAAAAARQLVPASPPAPYTENLWAGIFLVGAGLALGYAWWSGALETVVGELGGIVQGTKTGTPAPGISTTEPSRQVGLPALQPMRPSGARVQAQ